MPDGVRAGPAVTGERLAACSIAPTKYKHKRHGSMEEAREGILS